MTIKAQIKVICVCVCVFSVTVAFKFRVQAAATAGVGGACFSGPAQEVIKGPPAHLEVRNGGQQVCRLSINSEAWNQSGTSLEAAWGDCGGSEKVLSSRKRLVSRFLSVSSCCLTTLAVLFVAKL